MDENNMDSDNPTAKKTEILKIGHDVFDDLFCHDGNNWITRFDGDLELILFGDNTHPDEKILEEASYLAKNIQTIKARILKFIGSAEAPGGLGFLNTLLKRWNIEGFEMTNPEQPSLYEALLTLRGDDYGLWIVDMDHSEPLKFRREQT